MPKEYVGILKKEKISFGNRPDDDSKYGGSCNRGKHLFSTTIRPPLFHISSRSREKEKRIKRVSSDNL